MFLYLIAGHDNKPTRVLTFMAHPPLADALRPRADRVFRVLTTGEYGGGLSPYAALNERGAG